MAKTPRSADHMLARRLAAFVSGAALVLLVFNVGAYGLDNIKEGVRVLLLAVTVILAIWWQQCHARARWLGLAVGVIAAVLLVFNFLSFGVHGFVDFLTLLLLAAACIAAAVYAFGGRRASAS